MRKYILLLPLLLVVACGENNSTKYCADGSLAPCNDGSTPVAQSAASVNSQSPRDSATAQSGVAQQPTQAPAQSSSGFSWGDAAMGYVIGNMLFGGNSRNETVRERVIERPAVTQTPRNDIAPPTPSKNFNNQPSRNADIKPPAAKPPAAKPSSSSGSSYSAPKSSPSPSRSSSSFGGSSSRSSSGRR